MPKVSVIIPCFNQGLYLDEAVDSVLAQTFQDFEILVVDDGSTDVETVKILQDYARPKTRVIHTDNQGLSAARNNGIHEAQGAYILPLDADDKIGDGYLEDAIRILDRYPEIGIVYCEASYFGVKGGRWDLPEYSLDKIMNNNVIFCTALFRRADWEAVGGYNVNMVYGWEDWDFWLSLIQRGRKVYRIPKIHFYYRLREASMVRTMDEERQFFMRLHTCLNHRDLYRNIADIEIHFKVAELYLDTGMGFSPHQILRQIIFTDQTVIEFDLRGSRGIKQFRFDPINAPATIHINEIKLIAEDGTSREIGDFQSNSLYAKENNLIFETADPQISFSSAEGDHPAKLVVRLNFLSVGHEVFQDILNYKNRMLNEKDQMLNEKDQMLNEKDQMLNEKNDILAMIYRSWSWRITRPLRISSKLFRSCKMRAMMERRRLFSFLKALPRRGLKALRIIRQEGWLGLWYSFEERFHLADRELYELWQRKHRLTGRDRYRISKEIEKLPCRPLISILLPVYNTDEIWLRRCLDSVLAQLYPHWELCIADDASTATHIRRVLEKYMAGDGRIRVVFREVNGRISAASNSALSLATGEYVALLDHDDELTPDALYEVASLVSRQPGTDMIYSDEDKIDVQGRRHSPFFKPDWSPDTFLSQMYTCHLGVYRTALVRQIGGFREGVEGSQDYDLVLRLTEHTERICHIPRVLYHWRSIPAPSAASFQMKDYAQDAGLRVVREALKRRGEEALVESIAGLSGRYRVRYHLRSRPQVSIILPTRDLSPLLDTCLKSVFEKTAYDHFEVIIVDNDSREPETRDLFRRWQQKEPSRFRVTPLPIPFNFSALINEGVRNAGGDLVLLLNNDIEVFSEDWLSEMAAQAMRPRVGAVGVKLLYPDDTVQHAGIVLGVGGIAGHSHKHFANDRPGYFDRLRITANCAAVTGACLMVKKARFMEVGGFDEALSVAFNDVDFCIRLLKAGYYNLCLSHLTIYHHESRTRGPEDTVEKQIRFRDEIELMEARWGDLLENDPFYSPHLTLDREDYSISVASSHRFL